MLLFLSLTFCILPFIGFSTPNVVFIWFDDLGFSETGFNGGMFATPILDDIAANSIKLNQHYTEPVCSASRSALLTGKYSWKTGLNYLAQPFTNPVVNSGLSLLPELLINYRSYIAGKYHLGYRYWNDMPFARGFNEGLVNSVGSPYYSRERCRPFSYFDDYYSISTTLAAARKDKFPTEKFCGDNLFDENYQHPYRREDNTDYIERILTDDIKEFIDNNSGGSSLPFFVYYAAKTPHGSWVDPPNVAGINYDANNVCGHIDDTTKYGKYRYRICKMVIYQENMIKEIIDALKTKNIYDDTVVIITSDNGGAAGIGRNLPLRGTKGGVYEGGIRTMALMTGGYVDDNILLKSSANPTSWCEYDGLFHVSDWYHTILSIAGLTDSNADDDHKDIDQWQLIQNHCNPNSNVAATEREEIIYMRMCGEAPNQEFYSTFITKIINNNKWKLVVNGSIIDAKDCPRDDVNQIIMQSGYTKTDGSFSTTPDEIEYENQINGGNGDLYNSDCYNDYLDDIIDVDFAYSELMLFDIENDKIEACNVAGDNPLIRDQLLDILKLRASEYDSKNDREPKPKPQAVLRQINTYDCDSETMSIVPWGDDSWPVGGYEGVWTKYIEKVDACPDAFNVVSMDGEVMSLMPYIITVFAVVLLISIGINIFCCIRKKKEAMSIANVEMTAKESRDMQEIPVSTKFTNAQSSMMHDINENDTI